MELNNFLQLVDIEDIVETNEYTNMIDITVDVDNSFMLANGIISHNSAASAFRKYRSAETMGAFSLRGKFINVSEITNQKLVQNEEAVNLMASVGLKLGQEIDLKSLRYGRVLIYTDADCLEENTFVMTQNGPKKISEVLYGDFVMTHTGEYKAVVNILEKEISKSIKIKVNGNEFICSPDHRMMVLRDDEVLEIAAKDIRYTDFLLLKEKS